MGTLKIKKVVQLPVELEPNAIYLRVEEGNRFSMHISDEAGTVAYSHIAEVGGVVSGNIADASVVGKAVLTADDAAAVQLVLGVPSSHDFTHTFNNIAQTLQINNIFEAPVDMGAGNAVAITTGSYFIKTVTTASTLSVSGVVSGRVNSFVLELTNGGNHTVTWWSGIKWEGGVPPQLTANGVDILTFTTRDDGVTWRGSLNSKDSK